MTNIDFTNILYQMLYENIVSSGLEVLYDDREESAGVKLNDADLLGLPVRVLVSPRNMKHGQVELKLRTADEAIMVQTNRVIDSIAEMLGEL